MASKAHQVKHYSYYFHTHAGGPAMLSLRGDTLFALIDLVDDTSPLPAPWISSLDSCRITFRRSALPALIDMLRNESPVWVVIDDHEPRVYVYTGDEPTGEGES